MNQILTMTYDEIIKLHRQKTAEYIARSFEVTPDRVQYIGEFRGLPVLSICGHQHSGMLAFEECDGPTPYGKFPPTIELGKEFKHVDNVLNRKTSIMAGQCADCGAVFFAEMR